LKKAKGPDMGTYDSPRAFNKTQVHGVQQKGVKILPGKKKTFIEDVPKTTSFVPAPGHYKVYEQHYAKLSQSPRSIRI